MRITSSPPIGGPVDVEHWSGRTIQDIAAECDQIRAERGLPDVLLRALLDDMAVIAERTADASCSHKRIIGLTPCGSCDACVRGQERRREYMKTYNRRVA